MLKYGEVNCPTTTFFAHSTKEQQEQAGAFDDLIRISVGIENVSDLISYLTMQ